MCMEYELYQYIFLVSIGINNNVKNMTCNLRPVLLKHVKRELHSMQKVRLRKNVSSCFSMANFHATNAPMLQMF